MIKYTVPSLLEPSFENFSERIALTFVGETPMTYGQLKDNTLRVASMLKSFGINKGDKVAILSSNMPNWGLRFLVFHGLGLLQYPYCPILALLRLNPYWNIRSPELFLFQRVCTTK